MDKTGNESIFGRGRGSKVWHSQIQQIQMTQQWHVEAWPRYKASLEDGDITLPKDLMY